MKQLKRKDLILEHYTLAMEATVNDKVTDDEITVRVWKPRHMGKLPAYQMKTVMENAARRLCEYAVVKYVNCPKDGGACWITGNPDYGAWDAQVVKRMDYRRRKVDIYICSLLVRPFSEEARMHYEQRMGLNPWDRLLLMWDSRQFDVDGGYNRIYERGDYDIYNVQNSKTDIAESIRDRLDEALK